MCIARIRMIDFFNAEDSQAFEEEYVKVAGSLLPLDTNLIMTKRVMKVCLTLQFTTVSRTQILLKQTPF